MRSIGILLLFITGPAQGQFWEPMADFPGNARDDAASFSWYCKVYVGTGLEVGWTPTTDWWQYDVVQYTWQQVASLPATPRQYATAQAIDGFGYVFGGLDANGPLNELWVYNTTTNEWTEGASLPASGRYASSSFTAGNKLYIFGGLVEGGSPLNELWEYDPMTDEWNQRANLPGVGRHRAAATTMDQWVGGSEGIVIGGADSLYNALVEVWRYTTTTGEWDQLASLPEGRYGASAAAFVEGPVLIAGAVNDTTFRNTAYIYQGQWMPYGELPTTRRGGVSGAADCPGWFFVLYGTGIDDAFVRHQDWYRTGYGFAVPEVDVAHVSLFPNPAHDRITIDLPVNWQQAMLTISDISGRIVRTGTYKAGTALIVSNMAPGVYRISVVNGAEHGRSSFIKLP
jgi:N-acetylneuraminic acid mutarotase